jgi:hypothetical protein
MNMLDFYYDVICHLSWHNELHIIVNFHVYLYNRLVVSKQSVPEPNSMVI